MPIRQDTAADDRGGAAVQDLGTDKYTFVLADAFHLAYYAFWAYADPTNAGGSHWRREGAGTVIYRHQDVLPDFQLPAGLGAHVHPLEMQSEHEIAAAQRAGHEFVEQRDRRCVQQVPDDCKSTPACDRWGDWEMGLLPYQQHPLSETVPVAFVAAWRHAPLHKILSVSGGFDTAAWLYVNMPLNMVRCNIAIFNVSFKETQLSMHASNRVCAWQSA